MPSAVPITNDMRIRDGSDFSIMSVDEIKPSMTSILYNPQART